mmetsp:Transcript_15118/g.22274  ORF Transcript_15118/g.22274 Transcript_15118/m.22274 type:complete len:102 (-) Transcript_15118:504-809(-)
MYGETKINQCINTLLSNMSASAAFNLAYVLLVLFPTRQDSCISETKGRPDNLLAGFSFVVHLTSADHGITTSHVIWLLFLDSFQAEISSLLVRLAKLKGSS